MVGMNILFLLFISNSRVDNFISVINLDFFSVIPDKHKFSINDAIVGQQSDSSLSIQNSIDDSFKSDQNLSPKIFNFFSNIR